MLAGRTRRERWLLLAAMVTACASGYFFLRFRPAYAEVARLQQAGADAAQRMKAERQRIAELSASPLLRDPPERLQRKLDARRAELGQVEEALRRLRRQFVPPDREDLVHQLKTRIVMAAERAGVRVEESAPFRPSTKRGVATTVIQPRSDADAEPLCGSHAQRLVVRSSFPALRAFLEALNDLAWQVTIVELDINAHQKPRGEETTAQSPSRTLVATMVLAL